MQMLNKEMEERKAFYETLFRASSEKSGDSRKAAAELENEIQNLQAGEERRGSSASQSNVSCFDPARWEQVFGETKAASFIHLMQQEYVRQYRTSGFPEQGAGGDEREDWEGDWDDERAPNEWYQSAALDPAVDSGRCQVANGGSGGGGNPSTPRKRTHARDSPRSPLGKHGKMEEDGLL